MKTRHLLAAATLMLAATLASAADTPSESWDGLVEVKSKKLDAAFLAPGADFRPYTKVLVDPTQAAFHKDWLKNMNDRRELSRRVSAEQANEILEAARTNFSEVFTEVFGKAGYTVVQAPGPDVLRVTPGVANLYVNAPDVQAPGRSMTFSANAGEAMMILELRDSQSNALLGRVLDRRETRQLVGMQQATRVSNVSDFRVLFKNWASLCVKGLEHLKEVSPVPETLKPRQSL